MMRHNYNNDNARRVGLQLVPVRFEFTHPAAAAVYITGTFNHWRPCTLAGESVSNLFEGRNSILKAASSPKAAHLAAAENSPLKKQS
jgi:hypothetical protein